MNLLVFAHRGEAKAFLNSKEYKPLRSAPVKDLYQSDNDFLLLTGEGIEHAMIKTAIALTYLHSQNLKIQAVINLGIAGSIDPNSDSDTGPDPDKGTIGKIYPIRTIYADRHKTEFKSFTTANKDTTTDLVTVDQRILDTSKCSKLRVLADTVDRESWGIAYSVETYFKIPFYCFKLISDNVNTESEFCQRVKEESENFSIKLYQYFSQHFITSLQQSNEQGSLEGLPDELTSDLPTELNSFYFTSAQKNLFLALLGRLNLKATDIFTQFDLEELLEKKSTPKEKTKVLLNLLQQELSPRTYQIKSYFDEISKHASDQISQFQIDPNIEKREIRLSAHFNSRDEIEQIRENLANFPLDSVQAVFDGNLSDV